MQRTAMSGEDKLKILIVKCKFELVVFKKSDKKVTQSNDENKSSFFNRVQNEKKCLREEDRDNPPKFISYNSV